MKSGILFLVVLLTISGLTLRAGYARPVTPLSTAVVSSAPSASEDTFDLTAFGAVGDGVTDDGPALQNALNAIAQAGGGTLFVPAGRYAIITPVRKDFSGSADSLTIVGVPSSTPVDTQGDGQQLTRGLDLTSEFVIKTGPGTTALTLLNLQSLAISEIVFIGTQEATTDAAITLGMYSVENATIEHCEFYGLSTLLGGAIVHADNCRLTIDNTVFLGSTGNSGVRAPVVLNTSWKGISVTQTIFADYGQRPNYFGKLGLACPISWIMVGDAAPTNNLSPRREAVIRDVFLDEGGFYGISVIPDYYNQQSVASDLVYISDLRMNVSSLNTYGVYITRTKRVLIERAKFGLSQLSDAAVSLVDIGEATLDKLECLAASNRIRANGGTGRLTVINSIYTHLNSQAQTTEVITTATESEDRVQYVRQQYLDVLGHEPDAAGHDYWSNILLDCGSSETCLVAKRLELSGYLSTLPWPDFSITGRILNEAGAGFPGVVLNLTGSQAATTQTDAAGNYRFEGLPTSGVYTVTPVRVHYTFNSPTWTTTTPNNDRVANFTAILNNYSIAGRVVDSTGQGLTGSIVTLSGSRSATSTTDQSGNYSFTVPAEGNYTVTAGKVHYTFAPPSAMFNNLSGNQTRNFTGTLNQHAITGQITENGSAVAGATVSLSGSQSLLATTDSDGRFSFTVPAGGNYTVVPSKTNYSFSPASTTFSDLDGSEVADFDGTFIRTMEFSAASYQVVEGGMSLVVTVVRNGDISNPATATYSTSDDSGFNHCSTPDTEEASSGCDYISSIGTVRFAAGEASKSFAVHIIDDGYAEGSESFEVVLSNLAGANMGSNGTANVTIADNETVNGTNPIDGAAFFVRQHYIDFFSREADPDGLAFWTNQITSCGTDAACIALKRANVSGAFFLSIEFQETGYLVYRIYKAAYGNLPQAPVPLRFDEFLPDTQEIGRGVVLGQSGWQEILEANKQAFMGAFVARTRFADAYPTTLTPTEFVNALFTKAGVVPSATDRDAAINEFGAGASNTADVAARGRALRRVAENSTLAQQEFNKAFVLMQYFGYMRRNPNDAPEPGLNFDGYNFWLGKLNQFGGNFVNAEMVKGFIVSGEYRQRFGP